MRPVIAIALAAMWGCRAPQESQSIHTSIRVADCTMPAKDVAARYDARDLGVQQCPAPPGWQVLLVSSDANTWIDIAGPGISWSGERPIVYESPIGNFPSVDSSPGVEWRRDGIGRPTSAIFRVTAQDPQDLQTQRSMFYVVRFAERAACLAGRVVSIEEARVLADANEGCKS